MFTLLVLLTTVTVISAADNSTTTSTDTVSTTDSPITEVTHDSVSTNDNSQSSSTEASSSTHDTSTQSTTSQSSTTKSSSSDTTSSSTTKSTTGTDTITKSDTTATTQTTSNSTSIKTDTTTSTNTDSSSNVKTDSEDKNTQNYVINDSKKIKTAITHNITNENIGNFFDFTNSSGPLTDLVSEGDTLDFQGTIELHNQSLTINKPVNIISSTNDGNISLDSVAGSYFGEDPGSSFIINHDGSYTNVTGIIFYNSQIWIYNASYVTLDNITVHVINQTVGSGNGHTSIRAGSTYVTVKNSYFYTEDNGGSSSYVIAASSHCTLDNCTIQGVGNVGNLVYLTTFNIDTTGIEDVNCYNTISNNHLIGPDTSAGICWAIALTGSDNYIINNTIDYVGIGLNTQLSSSAYNTYLENNVWTMNSQLNVPESSTLINNTFGLLNTVGPYSVATNNTMTGAFISETNTTLIGNTINGNVTITNTLSNITENNIITTNDYAINVTGSYNSIMENYLESNQLSGDKSVLNSGNENTIQDNRPYSISVSLDKEIIYNQENNITLTLTNNTNEIILINTTATVTIDDFTTTIEFINGVGSFEYVPTRTGEFNLILNCDYTSNIYQNSTEIPIIVISNPETTYNVTSYKELVEAVNTINSKTEDGEYYIVLQPNTDQSAYDITETINRGTGVIKNITIFGNGQTINGKNQYQFITVSKGYSLTIDYITITNCTSINGGAINNSGSLTVTNSIFSYNNAENGADIYTTFDDSETVILTNNTFSNYQANNEESIYTNNTIQMTDNTFILPDNTIYEEESLTIKSPILDTSLSSNEKVTFEITSSNNTDSKVVTKNSQSVVELEYTFTQIDNYNIVINYESTYTKNIITGPVYVKSQESRMYVTSYEELVQAIEVIKSKTVNENYTIILEHNDDPTAYDVTETIFFNNGVVTNITIIGNGLSINGQEKQFMQIASGYYLELVNITITNCSSTESGAIYNNGTLEIVNSYFNQNTASTSSAGAIYNRGTLNIGNSSFNENSAKLHGGVIYNTGNLSISNSVFENNSASGSGGVIENSGNIYIINSTFNNNKASSYGGVIDDSGTITINDSSFSNNEAYCGGVIDSYRGVVDIFNSNFTQNTVSSVGGVIEISGDLTITDSNFIDNYAYDYGGAIYNAKNLTITNSSFINNEGYYGGVIYNSGDSIISNSIFTNNTARRGGAIWSSSTLLISNSILTNNNASDGNALYNTGTLTLMNNTISNNNSSYVNDSVTIKSPIYDTKYTEAVDVIIGNDILSLTPASGVVSTTYTFTESGIISVIFDYQNYGDNNITIIATVHDTLEVTLEPVQATVGETVELKTTVTLYGKTVNDGYVIFKVNGKTVKDEDGKTIMAYVDENGVASINYTIPATYSNEYNISMVYSGSEGIARSNSIITASPNTAIIEVEPLTAKAGQTVTLTAHITDANGKAITSGKLIFKLNGKTLKNANGNTLYATIEDGVATLVYTIPENYSAKDYILTAVFQATGFERSESNSTLTLTKSTPTIVPDSSVFGTNNTITINQGQDSVDIKATIIDPETNAPINTTTVVTIKINDKTVTQEYVSNGQIDMTIYTSSFKNPEYNITVVVGENSMYDRVNYNGTLIVNPMNSLANETSYNGTLLVKEN